MGLRISREGIKTPEASGEVFGLGNTLEVPLEEVATAEDAEFAVSAVELVAQGCCWRNFE